MDINSKLNVGIIGSGKIGTDLLIKILRSELLQCELFVGRNLKSEGLKKAKSLGVNISDQSIDAFSGKFRHFDLVFDATSAEHHILHAQVLSEAGVKVIDLTPAKVGEYCVPSIDADVVNVENNVNMVTCGGQASIPIVEVLTRIFPRINKIGIESHLAEDSIGPGTLANIDEYYSNTAAAVTAYSGVADVHVDLTVEKSPWKPDMLTKIRARVDHCDLSQVYKPLMERLARVRSYVPGYHIIGTPSYQNGSIEILVSIRGQGDWIPSHAGNLDIINCAAIAIAERYALAQGIKPSREYETSGSTFGSLMGFLGKTGKSSAQAAAG